MPAKSGEVLFKYRAVFHLLVNIYLFRDCIGSCRIIFYQKIRAHLSRVVFITDEEIYFVGNSSPAVAYDSYTCKFNILRQCNNVKIIGLVRKDILTVFHLLYCVYAVAELCRFFKLKIIGCFVHLLCKLFNARFTAVLHILYCRAYHAVVLILFYLACAYAHASFYMIVKAWTFFSEISRKHLMT